MYKTGGDYLWLWGCLQLGGKIQKAGDRPMVTPPLEGKDLFKGLG